MTKYPIAIYFDHQEVHFEYSAVSRLAKVSEEFIHQCECEELILSCNMLHGKKGLCFADVYKLKLIRHLYEDMGLDLEAVDLVLRYRNRIQTIQCRLDEMEQRMRQKEQEHLNETLALRQRLAQLSAGD